MQMMFMEIATLEIARYMEIVEYIYIYLELENSCIVR